MRSETLTPMAFALLVTVCTPLVYGEVFHVSRTLQSERSDNRDSFALLIPSGLSNSHHTLSYRLWIPHELIPPLMPSMVWAVHQRSLSAQEHSTTWGIPTDVCHRMLP